MTTPCTFTDPASALQFVRAGRAIVTIKSRRTGEHRTYRISRKTEDQPLFVALLTSPDDYTYVGILDDANRIRTTAKSRLTCDSVPVRAWNYVAAHLTRGEMPQDAEVMHEGRCGVCARPLTVPESIERGIGPECWARTAWPGKEAA